ncbi:hypothetical protein HYH03_003444 [Edaphochlamys debaryana]|uniref:Rad21/Rec8-like protein N-terminal domain-containing protein n=1 Tax=Edaphochlamys debaryana TaxID=47281 RepID=A0A835YBJ9_9CHLO|nr:hypothetical protein HYH03_003444 [Edaphochlamys debaryana]|eukprot:KAG2498704.1 hypothetical protein HYH03_003444 [Edaphochlamys debaryana]
MAFYAQQIFGNPSSPLWLAWHASFLAGERGPGARAGLGRASFAAADVRRSVDEIYRVLDQRGGPQPLALRLSGQLLLGTARIHMRQVKFLLDDCEQLLQARITHAIAAAAVSGGAASDVTLDGRRQRRRRGRDADGVDLAPDRRTAADADITLHARADPELGPMGLDLDLDLAEDELRILEEGLGGGVGSGTGGSGRKPPPAAALAASAGATQRRPTSTADGAAAAGFDSQRTVTVGAAPSGGAAGGGGGGGLLDDEAATGLLRVPSSLTADFWGHRLPRQSLFYMGGEGAEPFGAEDAFERFEEGGLEALEALGEGLQGEGLQGEGLQGEGEGEQGEGLEGLEAAEGEGLEEGLGQEDVEGPPGAAVSEGGRERAGSPSLGSQLEPESLPRTRPPPSAAAAAATANGSRLPPQMLLSPKRTAAGAGAPAPCASGGTPAASADGAAAAGGYFAGAYDMEFEASEEGEGEIQVGAQEGEARGGMEMAEGGGGGAVGGVRRQLAFGPGATATAAEAAEAGGSVGKPAEGGAEGAAAADHGPPTPPATEEGAGPAGPGAGPKGRKRPRVQLDESCFSHEPDTTLRSKAMRDLLMDRSSLLRRRPGAVGGGGAAARAAAAAAAAAVRADFLLSGSGAVLAPLVTGLSLAAAARPRQQREGPVGGLTAAPAALLGLPPTSPLLALFRRAGGGAGADADGGGSKPRRRHRAKPAAAAAAADTAAATTATVSAGPSATAGGPPAATGAALANGLHAEGEPAASSAAEAASAFDLQFETQPPETEGETETEPTAGGFHAAAATAAAGPSAEAPSEDLDAFELAETGERPSGPVEDAVAAGEALAAKGFLGPEDDPRLGQAAGELEGWAEEEDGGGHFGYGGAEEAEEGHEGASEGEGEGEGGVGGEEGLGGGRRALAPRALSLLRRRRVAFARRTQQRRQQAAAKAAAAAQRRMAPAGPEEAEADGAASGAASAEIDAEGAKEEDGVVVLGVDEVVGGGVGRLDACRVFAELLVLHSRGYVRLGSGGEEGRGGSPRLVVAATERLVGRAGP